MSKNKKKKNLSIVIAVLLAAVICMGFYITSGHWKKVYIAWQMNSRYDLNIKTFNVMGKYKDDHAYVYAGEGLYVRVITDWKGTILEDDYPYYCYADQIRERVYALLDDSIECYIVVLAGDISKFDSTIPVDETKDFESFISANAENIQLKIYIKDDTDEATINEIFSEIIDSGEGYNFSIIKICDSLYDELADSEIKCFWSSDQVIYEMGYGAFWDFNDDDQNEFVDFVYNDAGTGDLAAELVLKYNSYRDEVTILDAEGDSTQKIPADEFIYSETKSCQEIVDKLIENGISEESIKVLDSDRSETIKINDKDMGNAYIYVYKEGEYAEEFWNNLEDRYILEYLDETVAVGSLKDVCDASIEEWVYRNDNIIVIVEQCVLSEWAIYVDDDGEEYYGDGTPVSEEEPAAAQRERAALLEQLIMGCIN